MRDHFDQFSPLLFDMMLLHQFCQSGNVQWSRFFVPSEFQISVASLNDNFCAFEIYGPVWQDKLLLFPYLLESLNRKLFFDLSNEACN